MRGDRRHGAPVPGAAMAPAHADPANAPSTRPFPITGGGTTYPAAVVPRQGGRTPALVTTSNDVCMPDRGGHVTLAFPVPQELFRTGCVNQQDTDPLRPERRSRTGQDASWQPPSSPTQRTDSAKAKGTTC